MSRGLVVECVCGLVSGLASLCASSEYSFRLAPHSELEKSRDLFVTRDSDSAAAKTRFTLYRPTLVRASRKGCSTDFYVPYNLPQEGHTLSSQSPLVAASSTRPNHPKSSLPPAQSRPLASRQVQPVAMLNSNSSSNNDKGLRPYLMNPQHPRLVPPPNCPPRRSPSRPSHPAPQRWRLIHH